MNKRELRKLMCSMLLGDGYIIKETKTAAPQFGFRHSWKQKDYALWKANQINRIFEKKNLPRRCYVSEHKTNEKYDVVQVNLSWSNYMRIFRRRVYKPKKDVSYLLREIDSPKHLAIWFMDDGSEERSRNRHKDGSIYICNPRMMLHICSFTDRQAELIKQWFESNYKITPRIVRTSKKQGSKPRLRFTASDSRKLFPVISPYIRNIESMRKKFWLCLERY